MFERFTDRARRVVVFAQEEARMLNHNYIGTEHILLGLLREHEGVAARALQELGISLDRVREQVEEIIGQGETPPPGHIPFTHRAKKVMELSLREALQLGHNYIGTEHILLGVLREGEGVGAQVLVQLGADLDRVRQEVVKLLAGMPGAEQASEHRVGLRRLARGVRGLRGWGAPTFAEPAEPMLLDPDLVLQRLTDPVLRTVIAARAQVRRVGAARLEPLHLVAGILDLEDDPAATLLIESGVTPDAVRALLDETGNQPVPGDPVPAFAPETWQALALVAAVPGDVPTLDLLGALLEASMAARVGIKAAGGSVERLRAGLEPEQNPGGAAL